MLDLRKVGGILLLRSSSSHSDPPNHKANLRPRNAFGGSRILIYIGSRMSKERSSQGPAKVIADAFERVSLSAAYRGRWLSAYDYVSILRFEHDLVSTPDAILDSAALVCALSKDSRYSAAESMSGTTNGVFRKVYRPKKRVDGSRFFCYYVESRAKCTRSVVTTATVRSCCTPAVCATASSKMAAWWQCRPSWCRGERRTIRPFARGDSRFCSDATA